MKIGIDIRSLMSGEYSGVPEYTVNLLQALLKIDTENEYKLFYNSWKKAKTSLLQFESDRVSLVKTKFPNKLFNFLFQKILKIPKIDQLLQVDLFFMPNIGFVALGGSSKSIITVHDLSFVRYPEFFSFKRRLWHRAVNIKKLLSSFDKIVSVSQHTKDDLIDLFGIDEKKISVIHSAINSGFQKEIDTSKRRAVRIKYKLPKNFIFSLATIEPRKNLESIIEAYVEYVLDNPNADEISLVIAGAEGWKKRKILKTLRKSKLRNRIHLIGYVDKEDKKILYSLSKLFIYASYYEGFGFPPIEAMALGCPSIVAANSSLPEVVGEGAFLVNSFKISEIEQAIRLVLSEEEYRKELILSGLKCSKKYNWDESARRYLELFRDLKNS